MRGLLVTRGSANRLVSPGQEEHGEGRLSFRVWQLPGSMMVTR